MIRRDLLRSLIGSPLAWNLLGLRPASASDNVPKKPRQRGVNLAGAEFGLQQPEFFNENPGHFGRDYTWNSEETVAYFASKGITTFRVPFRWERIQPRLGEALNEAELAHLVQFVGWAKSHGCRVLIEVHNFGRYRLKVGGKIVDAVIDSEIDGAVPVSRAHFADLWKRLAEAFRDDSTVFAHGLSNEPHDMGASDWKLISQAVVDAIRSTGDRRLILVPGNSWSAARRFIEVNGTEAWIRDPADNVAYEAHSYWDADNSGTYKLSYDEELKRDPKLEFRGVAHLMNFAGWCAVNQVKGFIGEYGVPKDDPGWFAVLGHFLRAVDKLGMESCYWAAGEWWGRDRLSIQPTDDFRTDAVQLAELLKAH